MTRTMLASLGAGVAQNANGAVAASRAGTIHLAGTSTPVTIYTTETAGTTYSTDGTFTTDTLGRIPGWVELGLEVDITVPPAATVTCITQGTTGAPGVGASWKGVWSSGTTYAVGDGVTGSDGHNYISLVGSNLNHNPVGDAGVHWSDLLPSSLVSVTSPAAGDVPLRQPGGAWASAAAIAPAMVAHTAAPSTSGSAITTAAIDTTGATLLALSCAWKTSAMPTITDSKGNTWTLLPTQTGSDGSKLAFAVCIAPTVGSGHTFTATGAASSKPSVAVQAFSGTQGNAADVNVGTAASAVSSISTGAFTLAVEGEIVIAATGAATNADTFAVDRGWRITDQLPGVTAQSLALAMACRWRPTNSTVRNAGHFPTWTGGSSAVREAVLASFK